MRGRQGLTISDALAHETALCLARRWRLALDGLNALHHRQQLAILYARMTLQNEQPRHTGGPDLLGSGTGRAPLLHGRGEIQRANLEGDALRL